MIFVAGRRTNLFAECLSLFSTEENSRLPLSNLANGNPALPAGAADASSPWDIILDGRLKGVTDPGFDGSWPGGAPDGWGKLGTNIVRDTVITSNGHASVRFDLARANEEALFIEVEVACGARLDIKCDFRREELSTGAMLSVMCRDTGRYWNPDLGWVTEQTPCLDGNAVSPDSWGTVSLASPLLVPNLNDTDAGLADLDPPPAPRGWRSLHARDVRLPRHLVASRDDRQPGRH